MAVSRPIPLSLLLRDAGIEPVEVLGRTDVSVAGLQHHAQSVGRHQMFLARRGTCTDSHSFVAEAARRGASVILVDREVPWIPGTTVVRVADARKAAGRIIQAFHRHPAKGMVVAGVTGTNGKTTVTHLLESILRTAGMRTGLIGTIAYRWNDRSMPAPTTTPSALAFGTLFSQMEADRVEAVVMEVSSHAIDQERIAGIPFRVGALTNVSQEHMEYHAGMPEYISVKRRFFVDHVASVPGSTAVFNIDDPVGEELAYSYAGHHLGFTMDYDRTAPIVAFDVNSTEKGTFFRMMLDGRRAEVNTALVGAFNVQNILAASAMALCVGIDVRTIVEGIERVKGVPGRFERIDAGQNFTVVVDFAHTPAALDRMLHTARRITPGRLITVFGCGGRRDSQKRAAMGAVVGRYSDFAIISNDNPRTEDPQTIARQAHEGVMESGLRPNKVQILLDRRRAIEEALHLAQPGDTVVIAGRGHETQQDLGAEVIPFDDREVAASLLREMAARAGRTQEARIDRVAALSPSFPINHDTQRTIPTLV